MAMASYFDKTALSVAAVLRGCNVTAIEDVLGRHKLAIVFGEDAVRSADASVAIELCTNLAARLYPRITLTAHGRRASPLAAALADHARLVNPGLDIESRTAGSTIAICVGNARAPTRAYSVRLGADGWVATLTRTGNAPTGSTGIPFGGAGAACLASARVFRHVFRDFFTPSKSSRSSYSVSMIDLSRVRRGAVQDPLGSVDLGEVQFVGLGAIGSAAAWTLSKAEGIRGLLHLVDAEQLELSNLQRYVLATERDVAKYKVDVAAEALSKAGFGVQPHRGSWESYLAQRSDWRLPRVAVAVDRAETRFAIQGALPRWIANAWTGPDDDSGVSRHRFGDGYECLACLYFPRTRQSSEAHVVANSLGLTGDEAAKQIAGMLVGGVALNEEFLTQVANALRLADTSALHAYVGQPLRTFYTRAVCGGEVLRLQKDQASRPPVSIEAPLAFQSALSGVLLSGAIVADAAGIVSAPPPTSIRMRVLEDPPLQASQALRPAAEIPCLCGDPDYREAYRAKYGLPQ